MKIQANGIQFECRLDGNANAPWLVLINSLSSNLGLWDAQVAAFADRFRILRYDQRGHGGTEAPDGAYSFDQLIDDAAAVMDSAGAERATIVGVSMGATTAIGLAAKFPAKVAKIVPCDGSWESAPGQATLWDERIAQVEREGMEAMVDSTVARWFRPAWLAANSPALAKVRAAIRATPSAGYIGCARALSQFDFRHAARSLNIPVLLVVGENDGILPQVMRTMHEGIAGSQFVTIPDAGHLPNVERPEEFNRAIQAFLE